MALNPDNIKGHEFKPGQSGNPAGRPPGIPNSKTRYLRLLALTEKIKNPVTGELEEFSIMEQLDMQIIAQARRGNLGAYKEIMDRLEGRTDIPTGASVVNVNFINNLPRPANSISAELPAESETGEVSE